MNNVCKQLLVWILAVLVSLPWPVRLEAQGTGTVFRPEEIEQLVAPIALYPDSLVSQILMASTYPLEVVEAARWAKANKTLKGDALTTALERQNWNPSVKSLVNFPQVLEMMDQKLDLTQRLGDAFLAQQKDVLDAVLKLGAVRRRRRQLKVHERTNGDRGATGTTNDVRGATGATNHRDQDRTDQSPGGVRADVQPDRGVWRMALSRLSTLYVCSVLSVRVGWEAGALAFTAGVAPGAAWGYAWGGCNWRGGDVDVNVNRNTNFNPQHQPRELSGEYGSARAKRERLLAA